MIQGYGGTRRHRWRAGRVTRRSGPPLAVLGLGSVAGELRSPLLRAVASDLAVAGAVDVETDGAHGDAVEDGDGEGGVAEVLARAGRNRPMDPQGRRQIRAGAGERLRYERRASTSSRRRRVPKFGMSMTTGAHAFEEHLGELEIRIEAESLPGLFVEAGRALAEAMQGSPLASPSGWSEDFVVNAGDREALLVEWLNELVLRSEVAKVLFTDFEITRISDRQLVGVARGTRVERLRNPVKAATYHGLSIVERDGRITAKVILDV